MKIKRVEMYITACLHCPNLWLNAADEAFCKNTNRAIQPPQNGLNGLIVLEQTRWKEIPDWCPLPDVENSEESK